MEICTRWPACIYSLFTHFCCCCCCFLFIAASQLRRKPVQQFLQNDQCDQRRLRSDCASALSDLSLRYPHEETGYFAIDTAHSEDPAQTARMRMLILVLIPAHMPVCRNYCAPAQLLCHDITGFTHIRGQRRARSA